MKSSAIPDPIIEELKNAPEPIEIFRRLKIYPNTFFLDSACDYNKLGRYSFIGTDPFLIFKSKKDKVMLEWSDGKIEKYSSNPFTLLKELLGRYDHKGRLGDLPLCYGGAVGYFSYDLKGFIENLPDRARDDLRLPDCTLGFYDTVIVCDNRNRKRYAVSTGLPSPDVSRIRCRLDELKRRVGSDAVSRRASYPKPACGRLRSNVSRSSYIKAVKKAKEYVRKGDIYQVNLSQRFDTPLKMDPTELYSRLRAVSPAPFSAYLDFKDAQILSSSPERFIYRRGSYIETRPIKGTRPRGENASEDLSMEKELAESRKDMAEHIMIVDLERNDLGRICKYGSVRPAESAIIERYANVFHMVSTVKGKLSEGVGPVDCLLAAFPGGSITGAPKIRSMEIIDQLEDRKRSVYTGSLGYIGFDRSMDMSIVIRTFIIKDDHIYFHVGGGIVADSDPEKEYEETLHKARGLMDALGCNASSFNVRRSAGRCATRRRASCEVRHGKS